MNLVTNVQYLRVYHCQVVWKTGNKIAIFTNYSNNSIGILVYRMIPKYIVVYMLTHSHTYIDTMMFVFRGAFTGKGLAI